MLFMYKAILGFIRNELISTFHYIGRCLIITIGKMRAKQQLLERQIKEELKDKIKQKKQEITSHFKTPLPAQKNKTSTYNPSYVRKQKQNYIDMRKNLHLIINKASFQALRKQVKTATFKSIQSPQKQKSTSLNPKDMFTHVVNKPIPETVYTRVMGCLPNQNSLSQLWALVADQLYNESFFIFNVGSNLFLKVENDKVCLAPKQKTKEFLFQIVRETDKTKQFSIYKHSVVIKSMLNGRCLLLRGVLSLGDMNMNNESQQFYLKKVGLYEAKALSNSLILFNPLDKERDKAFLSIRRDKQQISYQKLDYSLYQRWIFAPSVPVADRNTINQSGYPQKQQQQQLIQQQKQQMMREKSKLQSLPQAQIDIIAKATRNLIKQYDRDCTQIINLKLQKSLSVKEQTNGDYYFIFTPTSQQRQWRVQSDGYSLKIKHDKLGLYLSMKDGQILLQKSPFYWQVFESGKNPTNSNIGSRKNSAEK